MAITENILIPRKNLARNPIVASIYGGNNLSNIFRLYEGIALNELIYEGVIYNIDDYVRVDLSPFFGMLQEKAGVKSCRICLVSNDGTEYGNKNFDVYGGGISKNLTRQLAVSEIDVFSWKLKNVNKNFFLSTRSNGRTITIPEDELLPLSFYAKGLNFLVKVNGETIATYNHCIDLTESLQSIDFNALRLEVVATKNKLVSSFDIITSTGGYVCTILITEVTQSHDYFLKFLNSWGVFEKISITGLIEFNPTFSEIESISKYDSVISDFVDKPNRKTVINSYKAEIGYKTVDERLFLIDLFLSDECFLFTNGIEYAVSVKTDSSLFQDTSSNPKSISIIMQLLDKEYSFSPLIDSPNEILGTNDGQIVTVNNFKIGV